MGHKKTQESYEMSLDAHGNRFICMSVNYHLVKYYADRLKPKNKKNNGVQK